MCKLQTPVQCTGVQDSYGLAYVPESVVVQHIADASLIQVLDDWSPKFAGYYLHYSSRRQNLPAFAVVINALRMR